jgi:beta-N-acetylhexosaminidase
MVATAKHFPTHAGARADSHREIAVDRRDYEALYDDLEPYRRLIAAGLPSVMIAHVVFPALDALPASFSKWWIQEQLRSELGFKGVVISDDIDMQGAAGLGDHAARASKALAAGCDMVLLCTRPDAVPAVLESLAGYSNPAQQLRLMRLRGTKRLAWSALHASDRFAVASRILTALSAPPPLDLEG